jgi:hypothetical protein
MRCPTCLCTKQPHWWYIRFFFSKWGGISDKRLIQYETKYDQQWAYMRGEDHRLRKDWWQANVKGHIVLVDEPASLAGYLVHHPRAKWAKRSTIVLAYIAGVVANRGKNPVCWVRNEAMRPEVLCPRVEVSGEFKNRIAQLPTTKWDCTQNQPECINGVELIEVFLTASPLRLKIMSFLLYSTMTSASCGM